ncbi:MAG TPA: hypothetical protein VK897_14405 [Anaerolineales bacterium]|nr:hypothetical protein [Anaerolineales bacterium]
MKETPQKETRARRNPSQKPLMIAAAVLAITQACLTIQGRGIEGFILWVLILFFGYWLFFNLLIWVWRRYREHGK